MSETKVFEASPEAKAKAKQLRIFAIVAWVLAMAGQVFAILKLISDETLVWLIVAIVVILIFAITGSTLWKRANKLDPASEKDKLGSLFKTNWVQSWAYLHFSLWSF
jgi:predicted signal transduction protein with EAL and GGDEF domain